MMKPLLRSITTSLLVFLSLFTYAQEIRWNSAPSTGYVFQINNQEAQKLLTVSSPDTVFNGLLHTLIDTFNVKKGWKHQPDKGHFVEATIVGNKLHCKYTSVFPYQVFLIKEYDALSLQVLDKEGNVRNDALVKFKLRRLHLDKESKTYRLENGWVNGSNKLVTVELDGFRSVFKVQKHEVPVWDDDYYRSGSNGPDFYSYMITDKNKYKPGEKVRFKSYALSQSRSPLRKDLQLTLYTGNKLRKLAVIAPHRPGSYTSEFSLHDSLKLTLDRSYTLELREKNGRIVASCHFKYEDYELNGNKLEIALSNVKQYHPAQNELSITATDVNGLQLKDARASVLVKTISLRETFQPLVILPDTLLFTEINLDPAGATVVQIPSSLFQKTNTAYEVKVTMLNSENKRLERSLSATHYYSRYELTPRLSTDSIIYEMFNNDVLMKNVKMELRYDNEVNGRIVTLPFKEKINPAVGSVHFRGDLLSREVVMRHLAPKLEITGGIASDSFNIQMLNPQQLEVSWYIYQGSTLLQKGFGKKLDFKSKVEDVTQTYYVELLYTFGGEEHLKRREYEFKDGHLQVTLDVPDRVFPGQQVEALIRVKDQLGHPVSGVDLTALAVTGKLNYNFPDLPYYGSNSSPRSKKADYSKNDINERSAGIALNYNKWNKLARLDTMKYYQFTYPHGKPFVYEEASGDSTQFAVYVMQQGIAKEVYVIEANRKPVYYSWMNYPHGYSFYVSDKKKQAITLRMYDRVLMLDSLSFSKGKKTIVSIDLDHLPANVQQQMMYTPPIKPNSWSHSVFTSLETNRYISYISSFSKVQGDAYLEKGKVFVPLFSRYTASGDVKVGPVLPDKYTFSNPANATTITYKHEGRYHYSFEDNVVYKLNAVGLIPETLANKMYNPMTTVNDRVITKEKFLEYRNTPDVPWKPRIINMVDHSIELKAILPENRSGEGVAVLLFQDVVDGKIAVPCRDVYKNKDEFFTIPRGRHHVIVLYTNGRFLKMENVSLKANSHVMIDFNESILQEADSLSLLWRRYSNDCHYVMPAPAKPTVVYHSVLNGNVQGVVYDHENLPIPGVNVLEKGTANGTVTDVDGRFSLDVSDINTTLVISFIGYVTKEQEVSPGIDLTLYMQEDVMQFSEVVVVAYGTSMRRDLTGAMSGMVAGVSISRPDVADKIDIDATEEDEPNQEAAEQQLYQELLTLKNIRTNFTDVGFWEPKLFTDRQGQSKFKITFPDDITRWDATVYAMNRRLQTGTTHKSIKSYKPLMAELHVPRFLTRGDSAFFLGKVLNYTNDKNISGKTKWTGARTDFEKSILLADYYTDLLPVFAATTDSLTTSYSFTRDDGYFDGEERTVPIVEQGTVRANGTLSILENKEIVQLKANSNEKIVVELMDSPLDIYAGDAKYLVDYKYACNEQLASKLLGLIAYQQIMRFEGKSFVYEKEVNKMIDRLLKNQNQEFLWSWWNVSSSTSFWMSAHILRALKAAKEAGYVVNLDVNNIVRKAEYKFTYLNNYDLHDIDLINALAAWDAKLDYAKYISKLEKLLWLNEHEIRSNVHYFKVSRFTERLLLMETRQLQGLSIHADSLLYYKNEGIMGDVSFVDKKSRSYYWYYNELTNNVIAYRIIKREASLNKLKVPMQLYFMNHRKNGEWDTYHSANVLTNVLPDLLEAGATKDVRATVELSGKVAAQVTRFPYKTELLAHEELTLEKKSGVPLYLMQYTQERVTKAKTGVEGFAINTWLNTKDQVMQAGKPVTLTVEVKVTKDAAAEYVMIEIPIPGSCSYTDKSQSYYGIETHREYFKEQTVIFCENMKPGTYLFSVQLLPRFTGKYLMNPAQVSLMYVPVVNANTDMKTVIVK